MTPGDRTPGRYKKTGLSVAMVALIAAGAQFPALYSQFVVGEKEGNRLVAYQDGLKIWTICGGLTRIDGIRVKQNDKLTAAQCDFYNKEHAREAEREMAKRMGYRWQELSEPAKVGIASWCWTNIGWAKCQASTFLRLWFDGQPMNDVCAQITNWIRDRGADCRKAGSNCQGQPVRRMNEDELCLIPAPAVEADQ
jgi:lysozyme